jgi:hypothetical protein
MRRAAKRDANHTSVGDHLRGQGWSVLDLASLGKGCPDYAVGKPGFAALVEVKSDPSISHRPVGQLTADQVRVLADWEGPYIVALSGPDAVTKLHAAMVRAGVCKLEDVA